MLFLRRTIIIYHRRILSSQVRERQNAKNENDATRTLPVACMDWDMISVSFFCCLGGLNAFVCVCVFKKVKDFERGELDCLPKKHVSFSLLPFFHPFSFLLFLKP